MILPMLANPVSVGDATDKRAHYDVEPKLDGWRVVCHKEGDSISLTSRTGKSFTAKVPHIVRQLAKIPFDFIVDGELGYLDTTHTELPVVFDYNRGARVLGSNWDTAIMKQERIWNEDGVHISLVLFDILKLGDEDTITLIDRERRASLIQFFTYVEHHKLEDVHMVPRFQGSGELEYFAQIVGYGGEGIMLKNPQGMYVPGKRPANAWYKLKAEETIDVVIMDDYLEGQGKYKGQVGAVRFGAFDLERDEVLYVGKCSGMTDAMRRYMTDHWSEMVGLTMVVKHFGKVGAEQGGLRHPNFVRFSDKAPRECRIEDL